MSEFQQAAIKETENFAKTPKEKSCQQIFNRGLSLSTASLTGCKCSKANVVVASSACWYQMFQQAIRLAIHFARRYLLGLSPNPVERRSSFCGCAFWRNASISVQVKSTPKADAKPDLWRASFVCFSKMRTPSSAGERKKTVMQVKDFSEPCKKLFHLPFHSCPIFTVLTGIGLIFLPQSLQRYSSAVSF